MAALLATHGKRTALQQKAQVTAHGSPKRAGSEYVAGAVRHIAQARAKADARAELATACRAGRKAKGAGESSDDESSVLMDSATEVDSTDTESVIYPHSSPVKSSEVGAQIVDKGFALKYNLRARELIAGRL